MGWVALGLGFLARDPAEADREFRAVETPALSTRSWRMGLWHPKGRPVNGTPEEYGLPKKMKLPGSRGLDGPFPSEFWLCGLRDVGFQSGAS